jgi:hypothetical protein
VNTSISNTPDETQTTVPLAAWQKARLLFECLPLLSFLVMTVIVLTVLRTMEVEPPPALYILIVVVVVVLGFQAIQRLRDFASGVAVAQDDVLIRSHRSRSGTRMFFGRFEKLGRMRLIPKAHFSSHNGMRYRVIYSPVSKIVWTLEPLDPYFAIKEMDLS